MKSVMFNLIKGLLYGSVIGILFGYGLYLLASAVIAIAPIGVTPAQLLALAFGGCTLAGVAKEYDAWMDQESAKAEE